MLKIVIAALVLVSLCNATATAQKCQIVTCTTIGNITTCTCI